MTDTDSNRHVLVNGERFVPYITSDVLQQRVVELADIINRDYDGKKPILICVLNGAFMFFADLVRHVRIDCEVDFLRLSSYGARKITSGTVRLLKDLSCEAEGRHIVLVEDIVDTGVSLDFMKKLIAEKRPASRAIATLLHKPTQTRIAHDLDYVGFVIPPAFVIGYGLDYGQQARNLPEVYMLDAPVGSQLEIEES
jgi:hypoxanthine phosphoribosyltransferase